MRQDGSYLCPHFELHRITHELEKGCCGTSHRFEYNFTCILVDGTCNGLEGCPRLNSEQKQQMLTQWNHDLKTKKIIKTKDFTLKDI